MKIRPARQTDVRMCLKLSRQEKYWSKNDFSSSVKDKDVVFLVAEENKKIIGYSSGFIVPTKRDEALMHETRVEKKFRGKKIGTKIVNLVCKELFKKKVKIIYAMVEEKLLPFYKESCKFKKTNQWIEVSKKK